MWAPKAVSHRAGSSRSTPGGQADYPRGMPAHNLPDSGIRDWPCASASGSLLLLSLRGQAPVILFAAKGRVRAAPFLPQDAQAE